MKEQKYNISMHTPIGIKKGIMLVMFDGEKITGNMELLQQKVPFTGNINENGDCQITGQIISLMRTTEYIATGKITQDVVHLILRDTLNAFKIYGVASYMEGEQNL